MKAAMILGALIITMTLSAQNPRTQGNPAQNTSNMAASRVPDAATAISIAEPVLVKVYGKKQIEYEKPLKAVLDDGVWHVYGTLCCPDRKGGRTCDEGKCVGGVAEADIRQSDGKVLRISHTM